MSFRSFGPVWSFRHPWFSVFPKFPSSWIFISLYLFLDPASSEDFGSRASWTDGCSAWTYWGSFKRNKVVQFQAASFLLISAPAAKRARHRSRRLYSHTLCAFAVRWRPWVNSLLSFCSFGWRVVLLLAELSLVTGTLWRRTSPFNAEEQFQQSWSWAMSWTLEESPVCLHEDWRLRCLSVTDGAN